MDQVYTYESLYAFTKAVFLKMGCSDVDATTATTVLVSADLRGIDSHGVARLSGYVRLWEVNRINATPNIQVVHETPSTAVVDGDAGLGLVVAPFAMQIAIEKAKQVGTGWVSVRNTNHFGIAGYHAMMALEHQMIGMAMTNASALVAPTFSIERMLGTNPIAVAIPAGEQPPFVADMATTTAANGKLEILQRKNAAAPLGWVQDKEGHASTDANILKKEGALLPLGSDREHGSHKGYALGAIVDIFSAVLSGGSYGPWAPPFPAYVPMPENMPGKGLGHFFGAMRVDAFRPAEEFTTHMDNWITRFRNAKPAPGLDRVLIPGDPEREYEQERMEKGIPIVASVVDDLKALGEKLGIAWMD
ncbi:MAG: Ldh family oxidoreductase [Sediminibacterium sp. Gen4]|jgi:L-2-hydroxycarboxylate dehydrogenase (NAD+)|uniref:Ldh family oxidoreductase n=1 Tax=unclassified Sediminibacterium TaxID=2635961 RepID=UPI0015BFC680|nr:MULTISPECIES: Ldh family oxidoreductase [unclassified Sediminibacterium]MBW0161918.1 Ldh family oxidoreductase [Sediminibacterium sp.]MBW0165316.1 Ldh family oxidoreductase [Sediminibacterium sp.]NWK65105.1 Ldh family oxidoreductase [Sediminibacterium sp. Gen4]